jgi:hypothetical protein
VPFDSTTKTTSRRARLTVVADAADRSRPTSDGGSSHDGDVCERQRNPRQLTICAGRIEKPPTRRIGSVISGLFAKTSSRPGSAEPARIERAGSDDLRIS